IPGRCLSGRRTARQMLGRAWQAGELAVTAALPIDRARVQAPSHLARRGGREVECAALEMRFTGNRNVGSNPTLSATCPRESVLPIRLRPDFSVVFEGYARWAEHWPPVQEARKRSLRGDILRTC